MKSGTLAGRAVLATLMMAPLLLGCASELSLRAPDVDLRNARLAFMPSMVAIYRIEGCQLVFDEGRSREGRADVDGWLRYYGAETHGRLASLSEVAGTDVSANDFYAVMNDLARLMFADWGRRPLSAWRLDSSLASWAEALHVDYLAFAIVRGSVLLEADTGFCGTEIVSPLGRAGLLVLEPRTGRIVLFLATKLANVGEAQITQGMARLTDAVYLPAATAK